MVNSIVVSNTANLQKYLSLDQKGKKILEYVWIDPQNNLRSKCMTVDKVPDLLEDMRKWNFDGSSTKHVDSAAGENSDVYLKPVAIYPCPFRGGDNAIVLCECLNPDGKPNRYNFRADAATLLEKHKDEDFQWGIEQEYTLLGEHEYSWPYGWPANGYPGPQGPYYCGNGTGRVVGRDIVEAHYRACLYAGLEISGTNAEVMPAQWEYQIGPCKGIAGADQLWISRFILERVAEEFGAKVTFHPKPVNKKEWNGAGLHTNVSTKATMNPGGMKVMESYMPKLEKRHKEHMLVYGEGNEARMTGANETASYDKFTWGVAHRGSSVRINRDVADRGLGYFEDRRPASNADPYRICAVIVETISGSVDGVDLLKKVEEAEAAKK